MVFLNSEQKAKSTHFWKIGLVANILEWYEFTIYGYLAITMSQLFLAPTQEGISQVLWAWFIFAFAYLARPLGSVFWGWLGDRVGSGVALRSSLMLMAIPTILIGCWPTYHTIGFSATISFFIFRFMQGFAAGGELPVSAYYIFENAPTHLRSVLMSTVSTGSGIGMLIASFVASLLYWNFETTQILEWAWRIPYLLSIPMTLWIAFIRKTIPAEIFPQSMPVVKLSVLDTVSKLLRSGSLSLILLVGFMEILCYVMLIWLPSYLIHFLHIAPKIAQAANIVILLALQILLLVSGVLAGKIGYKRLLLIHTALIILLVYPLFKGLQNTHLTTLIGVHLLFAWLMSGVIAVMMETLGNAYLSPIRCSGMSITHTLGATLFGGTAPVICTWLTEKTGWLLFPAYYMMAFGLLALPLILRLKRASKDN